MACDVSGPYVFIVKLWLEPRELPGVPGIPRCSAEVLGTGAAEHFESFHELAEFLSRNAGNFPVH
jgi:hypothetical protein